jgi:hypothetical protein
VANGSTTNPFATCARWRVLLEPVNALLVEGGNGQMWCGWVRTVMVVVVVMVGGTKEGESRPRLFYVL